MDSPFGHELNVAFAAVQEAAKLSQSVLSRHTQSKGVNASDVVEKSDLSPVTIGDFAIQALLTATFHAAFPGDRFVGEESADELRGNSALLQHVWQLLQDVDTSGGLCKVPESPDQMCEMIDWAGHGEPGGKEGGRVWVFDPIDGTVNFVKGDLYAINVALLENGEQVLGVVGCPNMSMDIVAPAANDSLDPRGEGCIAFAVRGFGTHVRPLPGPTDAVNVRRTTNHTETTEMTCVTCYHQLSSGLDAVHEVVAKQLGMSFPGSSVLPWVVRWVLLGLGVGNTCYWVYKSRTRLAKIWDHAGAMLLFEEGGGKITDVDGRPLDLGRGRKMEGNYGIVAAPSHFHGKVLDTVQRVVKESGKPELLAKPGTQP